MGAWLTGTNLAFAVSKLFQRYRSQSSAPLFQGDKSPSCTTWHTGACALGYPRKNASKKVCERCAVRAEETPRERAHPGKSGKSVVGAAAGEEEVEESVTHLDEIKALEGWRLRISQLNTSWVLGCCPDVRPWPCRRA